MMMVPLLLLIALKIEATSQYVFLSSDEDYLEQAALQDKVA